VSPARLGTLDPILQSNKADYDKKRLWPKVSREGSELIKLFCVRLDDVRCLFGNGDDWSCGVTADLVREYGRVDYAETLDAEYA
jgi:hypothetical protein